MNDDLALRLVEAVEALAINVGELNDHLDDLKEILDPIAPNLDQLDDSLREVGGTITNRVGAIADTLHAWRTGDR